MHCVWVLIHLYLRWSLLVCARTLVHWHAFGKLWIWEWFKDLSNRCSGWVSRRLNSGTLSLLPLKYWERDLFSFQSKQAIRAPLLRRILSRRGWSPQWLMSLDSLMEPPHLVIIYFFKGKETGSLLPGSGERHSFPIFMKLQRPFPSTELSSPKSEEPSGMPWEAVSRFLSYLPRKGQSYYSHLAHFTQ